MTPELRFSEFTDEWKVKRFGDVVILRKKKFNPLKSKESRKDIELDNLSSESGQILDFVDSKTQKSIKNVFHENDILYGKLRPYLKKFAKAPWDGVSSSEIWAMYSDKLDSNLLLQLVQTKTFNDSVNIQSGSKMPRADWGVVSEAEYAIPQKPEQEKIAEFLTAVDSRIKLNEQKIEYLKQYKRAVMQQIFSQQIRFKDENDNSYPEWQEKRLGDIAKIKKGTQLNRDNMEANGLYPVLNGGVSYSGYTDDYNSDANTITISEGGNSCGYVSFMTRKFWSGGHLYTIEASIDNKFLFYILQINQLHIMTLRVGSGLPNIQKGDLEKLKLATPASLEEQQKIANFLTALDELILTETSRLKTAKDWKKGLLQKMFV